MSLGTLGRWLAAPCPVEADPSADLVRSLSMLESRLDPATVVEAGYTVGAVAALGTCLLGLLAVPAPMVMPLALAVGLAVTHAVHAAPGLFASFRRTRALGDAPNLVGRAVLRMEIQPATEAAIQFAADTGHGPLAASLSAHVDRAMGTPGTGLISFAEEWAEEFPALRRAAHLLATAEDAPEAERARTLDRALAAVLDGTREEMAAFTSEIQGPTTALYAFGVMLPLAIVALVPAAAMVGFPVSITTFVVLYDLALPAVLIAAGAWLLSRRPVAFPPPRVGRSHPDVPDRRWPPVVAALVAGAVGYALPTLPSVRLGYLSPVAATGLGAGAFLLVYFAPITAVREHVRDVEEHLTDALYLVGRQVSEGEAVESALDQAGRRVPGETGAVFAHAAGIQRRLHLGVEAAFFGDHGALADIPSVRARGTASLLSVAAEEGRPAGRAVVSMAGHLEALQEVESEASRQLSTVTETLDTTAAYFGPLIAGTVLALADAVRTTDPVGHLATDPLATDPLGIVIGVYVLALSVILTVLSVRLSHGLDRALVGYHVGRSLLTAVPLFVTAVFLVGRIT